MIPTTKQLYDANLENIKTLETINKYLLGQEDSIEELIETKQLINIIRDLEFVVVCNKNKEGEYIQGLEAALQNFCEKSGYRYLQVNNTFLEFFFKKKIVHQLANTEYTISSVLLNESERNLVIRTRKGINTTLKQAGAIYRKGVSVHVSIGHQGVFTLGNFFNELSKLTENIIDTDNGDEIHVLCDPH